LNPRTWVLKASTVPLDHRSRRSVNIWGKLSVVGLRKRGIAFSQKETRQMYSRTNEGTS